MVEVAMVEGETEEEEEKEGEVDLVMEVVEDSGVEAEEKGVEGVGCNCTDSQLPSMYKIEIRTHRTCLANTEMQKYMFPYHSYLHRST